MSLSLSLMAFSVMGCSPAASPPMFTLRVMIFPVAPVKVSSYCEAQRKRMAPSACSATVSLCSSSSGRRASFSDAAILPFDVFTTVMPSGRYKSNWKPRISAVLFMQISSSTSVLLDALTVAGST